MSRLSERPQNPVVGEPVPHEAAALHVTGRALYTDDLAPRTKDVLHAWPVQSPHTHARIVACRPVRRNVSDRHPPHGRMIVPSRRRVVPHE